MTEKNQELDEKKTSIDRKASLKKIQVDLSGKLIAASKDLQGDIFKFLLLVVVAFVFGSPVIAIAYGHWGGIILLDSIMLFILVALYINKKSSSDNDEEKSRV